MILLIHSTRDIAGVNIAKSILQNYPFSKMTQNYQENPVYAAEIGGKQVNFITLKEEAVNAQYLQEDFPNAQLVVFISRHSSQSGNPPYQFIRPGTLGRQDWAGCPR